MNGLPAALPPPFLTPTGYGGGSSSPVTPAAYDLPSALPHLTAADAEELTRLLRAVFKDSVESANRWLSDRSDYFRCAPVDLLKRDEIGVVRVISYLKDAVQ